MSKSETDRIVEVLEDLKKLQILELLDRGFSQTQVALTLGVAQATVSRMFPRGALKRGAGGKSDETQVAPKG